MTEIMQPLVFRINEEDNFLEVKDTSANWVRVSDNGQSDSRYEGAYLRVEPNPYIKVVGTLDNKIKLSEIQRLKPIMDGSLEFMLSSYAYVNSMKLYGVAGDEDLVEIARIQNFTITDLPEGPISDGVYKFDTERLTKLISDANTDSFFFSLPKFDEYKLKVITKTFTISLDISRESVVTRHDNSSYMDNPLQYITDVLAKAPFTFNANTSGHYRAISAEVDGSSDVNHLVDGRYIEPFAVDRAVSDSQTTTKTTLIGFSQVIDSVKNFYPVTIPISQIAKISMNPISPIFIDDMRCPIIVQLTKEEFELYNTNRDNYRDAVLLALADRLYSNGRDSSFAGMNCNIKTNNRLSHTLHREHLYEYSCDYDWIRKDNEDKRYIVILHIGSNGLHLNDWSINDTQYLFYDEMPSKNVIVNIDDSINTGILVHSSYVGSYNGGIEGHYTLQVTPPIELPSDFDTQNFSLTHGGEIY